MEVVSRRIGVERAITTTVHVYTANQHLAYSPSPRTCGAGPANLVPTSTGAARAPVCALPALSGLFDGVAVRAPMPVGYLADIVFVASRPHLGR